MGSRRRRAAGAAAGGVEGPRRIVESGWEMEGDHLVLLPACCPDSDDLDILRLLEGVASACGAAWIELELITDGPGGSRRYRLGDGDDCRCQTRLALNGRREAVLRLGTGAGTGAGERLLGLASVALEKILEARRLSEQAELLHGALDMCGRASLLFDTSGAIVYANPQGDRLLSQQTELMLRVVGPESDGTTLVGRLCRLAEQLNGGEGGTDGEHGDLELSDGSVVEYEISLVRPRRGMPQRGVLVTLQRLNPGAGRPLDRFARRHGLSNREQQVVRLLLDGLSTRRIADELGISPHTVRDHLKNLYRKTGVSSRGQLVHLAAAV